MAGRGPRAGGRHQAPDAARETRHTARGGGGVPRRPPATADAGGGSPDVGREGPDRAGEAPDRSLVRICDLAGRPRGTGFVADHHGTVVTSHEAVDGLARLLLYVPAGNRTCLVTADSVTALPSLGLALVRCDGMGLDPLPITVRDSVETGRYVRIAAGGWREARVLGSSAVTYTATDRFHLLDTALELAIGTAGSDALRLGGGAAGGPVVDAATGAVVAVLGTALHSGRQVGGFAVPLSAGRPAPGGALAELLARNAATVPAYGDDLNLAGVLELTAAVPPPPGSAGPPHGVERPCTTREFTAFAQSPCTVLGLVGAPGSGRTTELAALAAGRGQGPEPAPTLWLRGADLLATDSSVADAARRALERAGRIVAATTAPATTTATATATTTATATAAADGDAMGAEAVTVPVPAGGSAHTPASAPGVPAEAATPGGGAGEEAGHGRGELAGIGPERLARLSVDAGRPLLLLLDNPEEMPPGLADRLPDWAAGSAVWLGEHGVRLVMACRDEYWERAGAAFPQELLYGARWGADEAPGGSPCVRLGDLEEDEAREARAWYGIPEGALDGADARHPLTLRLLSEVRAAMPGAPVGRTDRDQVFAAYLDLMCLRVAVRLATVNGLRGTAVRRLAARVSGQVHVAARRCLGPGEGELDRAAFETVFPWGPVPDRRLGGCAGWASAVLTEGLLMPAGDGYRFVHGEFADWLQGMHLDLDAALQALTRRHDTDRRDGPEHAAAVPRHRIGPVRQALLLLPGQLGHDHLTLRLRELLHAVDEPAVGADAMGVEADVAADAVSGTGTGTGTGKEDGEDGAWWPTRLLRDVLLGVPDATPYLGVLRHLAEHVVRWRAEGRDVPREFGPGFWRGLPLPQAHRFDLLRRLVVADEAPPATRPRYLDAVSELLVADPAGVQPHLTHWFDDDRTLPATPDATVATAAQALLHTHRRRALDDLTEALADSGHARADELLDVLAEDEPSALCRAVDRWAHDERPARRAAAMTYGLRAAPHVRTDADRELLRYAALTLLTHPGDRALHGSALALLVRDPHTRARYLPQALARFRARDPRLPPSALVTALETHPDPVLAAFHDRLGEPDAGDALRTLAEVTAPAPARRVAALVRDVVARHPEAAAHVAVYVEHRLEQGPAARALLHPLVTGLLDDGRPPLRAALAEVFAAPGTPGSRPLRREFLDLLLTHERDPMVLDALVRAAAEGVVHNGEEYTRALIHSVGLLLVRTPDGANRFDRALVDLGRGVPGFAPLVIRWLTATPEDWSTVIGPSTGRTMENLAGARVPV
ncbi:trypsin-like peptidase domain-containing protein [Streptomyces sp. NPDC020802]|uniref:trypsin-like peptidase domain-containing protein n=1 Tax=Streptomyces sp. NPDC020802 TaxID=3365094 RepID=UPI0037A62C8D